MVPTQAPHHARFQPVIFSDAGTTLYPLCETRSEPLPKALVPVLNRPMIAFPLQWLVSAGFRACLLVAPIAEHSALAAALRTLSLVAPNADTEYSAKPNVAVTARNVGPTLVGTESSSPSKPVMHVELVPFGPKPGESVRSLWHPNTPLTRARWGTAQILYWLAATRKLELDPLIVPLDLIAPDTPLSALIATHLSSMPDPPTLSCLFYERGAGEGTGKDRERDGPANLFSVYARTPLRVQEGTLPSPGARRDVISVHAPLLVMDSDDVLDKNASDLELRMSLLWKHPHARVSTTLLDSLVYIVRLAPLLPLLEKHPELNNIIEQLVPFMIKCSWQTRLSKKAAWNVPLDAAATNSIPDTSLELSNTNVPPPWMSITESDAAWAPYHPRCELVIQRLRPGLQRSLPPAAELEKVRAGMPGEESFIARANTVPTYLECNRYLLRHATSPEGLAHFSLPSVSGTGSLPYEPNRDTDSSIHPRAQLSADCMVGAGAKIEERATIKHSILGRNCAVGKGARIMRSVLMDGVHVGDNAKLENCIVGHEATIGDRSLLRETDVGPQYAVARGAESKNEKLVVFDGETDEADIQMH
ncbi:Translation initiation factor eIF-2B subunit gamma [Malassezia vespertilionis]|uniref:Translation initiation factor eIF2B subunit gamma n=1 Tax=Malassezia vespertilionis TaxID=2020962 RepID=A0A2N1JCP7_9BASI|nr:Translation initiation factor eIF-2B subunit gamma [Malassezia vespertilionis]PKI84302.1 hypothetical protein MVES_001452 [Malassezia vespertilionis]WFD06199.1 Translation initiation factor eIF-2B subunit gamma [Malassezia vespertilionis]